MRKSIVVVLAGCALITAGLGAAPAGAATYVETPCAGLPTDQNFWWDWNYGAGWEVVEECPNGEYIFPHSPSLGDPDLVGTLMLAGSTLGGQFGTVGGPIDAISAEVSTSDPDSGIEVGLQVCRNADCSALATPDSEGHIELQRDDSDPDVEIPVGANRVIARASCTIPVCSSPTIALSGLTITRSDDTAPIFELVDAYVTDYGDPDDPDDDQMELNLGPPRWNNGRIVASIQGDDFESGIAYWRFDIDPLHKCLPGLAVGTTVPDCDNLEPYAPLYMYASQLTDGVHQLDVTAMNQAGLSNTQSITVKTDTSPPTISSHPKVTPRFGDWVNSRDVNIVWKNTNDTVEENTLPGQSGITGYWYDVDPDFSTENPPPAGVPDPAPKYVAESNATNLQYRFPSSGTWSAAITTVDRAGNKSQPLGVPVDIENGRLPAPTFGEIPPINAEAKDQGVTIGWSYESTPISGVCGHDFAFSSQSDFNPGEDPENPTISGPETEFSLTPIQVQGLSEKPQRLHIRGYSCAGIAGAIARPPVLVDFTPPAITLAPAGGVVSSSDPVLIGVIDSKEGTVQSGFASVECTINGDPVACSTEEGVQLVPGSNHLVVTAFDQAGNPTTTQTDFVSDASPPEGWFEASDPNDPTLVRAAARDTGSGLASATMEYQPLAGGVWTRIGGGMASDSPSTDPVAISGRIPDDGTLPDGGYRLRLKLKDAGGSVAIVTLRAGGGEAGFTIPVRQESVVSAGLSPVKAAKSSATSGRLAVDYGEAARLSGRLTTRSGTPLAGALLTVTAIQQGAPPRVIGSATTDARGEYAYRVQAGATRNLVVRYAGGATARPTSDEVKLLVSGKVSLKLSRTKVRARRSVVLSGRVGFAETSLPLRGKYVEIAFKAANGGTLKKTTHTDAAGRFSISFSYPAKRPVRFTVRAISTTEAGWPYETGISPKYKFVVTP